MDPDATLTRIEDALTAGDGAELRDACADLLAWLRQATHRPPWRAGHVFHPTRATRPRQGWSRHV